MHAVRGEIEIGDRHSEDVTEEPLGVSSRVGNPALDEVGLGFAEQPDDIGDVGEHVDPGSDGAGCGVRSADAGLRGSDRGSPAASPVADEAPPERSLRARARGAPYARPAAGIRAVDAWTRAPLEPARTLFLDLLHRVGVDERVDHLVEIAVEDFAEPVHRQPDPVIRDSLLRIIVGSYLRASVAGTDLALALLRDLLFLFLLGLLEQDAP